MADPSAAPPPETHTLFHTTHSHTTYTDPSRAFPSLSPLFALFHVFVWSGVFFIDYCFLFQFYNCNTTFSPGKALYKSHDLLLLWAWAGICWFIRLQTSQFSLRHKSRQTGFQGSLSDKRERKRWTDGVPVCLSLSLSLLSLREKRKCVPQEKHNGR